MSEAVVPSWEGVRERRIARLRRVDQKLVIAVLIGLVSVTGAFMTWRSSQLGEKATDKDRQAVAETVLQEQANANVEAQLRNEHQAFVEYKQHFTNASLLENEATTLDAAGLAAQANQARDEAGAEREEANTLVQLNSVLGTNYVGYQNGLPTEFHVDQRRNDLQADNESSKLNPDITREQAIELRQRSQRLEGWTIPLVVAVVLLTIATFTRAVRFRPWIAGAGLAIFLLSTSIAFLGD